MQTLPEHLRKFVAENNQQVRDALRKLRKSDVKQVEIVVRGKKFIIRKPTEPVA